MFQSPSLRGSGRFKFTTARLSSVVPTFQSPSLRGSGRFMTPEAKSPSMPFSFNPLHCGAVVASPAACIWRRSICSAFQSPSLRGSGRFLEEAWELDELHARFNPLHCGAVVASGGGDVSHSGYRRVSIPFIAGQWSLRGGPRSRPGKGAAFQSPSLRGSGRFATATRF